ncbi:Beta-porphyranase A precursor [Planctomycetes bacterium CA13]|uniref:Beta-porphyranase A n=1 Tax=Novipirellula herctigrandis TaxID=2527986 RepID=A0A5C5Z8F6_9BACT|nr:Beta-porphyranase A precursor [Planctomycetes bacterium CA13]
MISRLFLSITFVLSFFSTGLADNPHPASDPSNEGGWTLNPDVSDEFEGTQLNESKWLIQGKDGVYKSRWIGRAPSQFSIDNVRLEDGMLKIESRWEPDFEFSKKRDMSWNKIKEGTAYENITTAAVICKNEFLYGYMEIKCKAADASVTSAFWATGSKTELDVFEFSGRPKQTHKTHLESELWSSIHDWSKPGGPTTWTDRLQLDWKVADGFHVYGLDWDPEYLKFYADGKLVRTVERKKIGDEAWVLTGPISIWVDSETFPWHGIPEKDDLPADYEIEYIRVWQKEGLKVRPRDMASAQAEANGDGTGSNEVLFDFEGPIDLGGKKQDWWIAPDSRPYFSITKAKASGGTKSLQFKHSGELSGQSTAFAPFGSMKLDSGQHVLSMKVWIAPDSSIKKLNVILEDPWLNLKPFDLTEVATGEWVTLRQTFKRREPSGSKDRLRIVVAMEDAGEKGSTLYIDDMSIE